MSGDEGMAIAVDAREILRGLPRLDWWSRKQEILRLLSCPAETYLGDLEASIRNHDDADARNAAIEVYTALGLRGLDSIEGLLRDADHEVRLFSVNILCGIASAETLPQLMTALNDEDVNVRVAAAEALGKVRDGRAIGALAAALEDEPWVAMAAIDAMGNIGTEALGVLHACLARDEYRQFAVSAIERAGDASSVDYLAGCLRSEATRGAALKAVVNISERLRIRPQPEFFMHYLPLLIEMRSSADPETRRAAVRAMSWSKNPATEQCLLEAVQDEDLQEYALEGLLVLGKRSVCGIIDELKRSTGPHRRLLAKTLEMMGEREALLQFSRDEDAAVRIEVALALGTVRFPRAEQELRLMLEDPSLEVREAARMSLRQLGYA